MPMIKRSIEIRIPVSKNVSCKPKVDIQFFTKKKQFKAFVEITDSDVAKNFFSTVFTGKTISLLDANFIEVMQREMRAYMVKTEEEFS